MRFFVIFRQRTISCNFTFFYDNIVKILTKIDDILLRYKTKANEILIRDSACGESGHRGE